jgi:glycerol-3-phosphate dehydrogenase (NAD(P)+)
MSTVTIIGAGMMGSALCWPLTTNQHTVRLAGTPLDQEIIASVRRDRVHPTLNRNIPEKVTVYTADEIPLALRGADWVICGVSSFGVHWFAKEVGPFLHPDQPVLSVTKGPDGDLRIFPNVIDRLLPRKLQGRISLNAIGGPCTALELADKYPAGVVFAGVQDGVLQRMRIDMACDYYHVWTSTDLLGVELAAAFKNAYALGVGLGVGIMDAAIAHEPSARLYNLQSALFAEAVHEMSLLLPALGGKVENALWLPGPGDLFTTIFGGRTVRLGRLLGQGLSFKEAIAQLKGVTLESVEIIRQAGHALPRLEERGVLSMKDYPLLWHLYEIIEKGKPVDIPWNSFFSHL